jgi:hypothetical protein
MSTGTDIDELMAALQQVTTTRFAERLSTAGGITVTVAPPDIIDYGYGGDVPCPPGSKSYSGAVLLTAASSDSDGARGLLDAVDLLAANIHAAGWTPVAAQAVDVDDRPGYLLRITRRARP